MKGIKKQVLNPIFSMLLTVTLAAATTQTIYASPINDQTTTQAELSQDSDATNISEIIPVTLSQKFMETADSLAQDLTQEPENDSFDLINQASVFLTQPRSGTCTLTSVTMMLRRAALLSDNDEWENITTETVEADAWIGGLGVKNSFSSFGMEVGLQELPGGSENKEILTELLEQHPEGVALYASGVPHCVLLTDVQDGVFYCADTLDASVGRTTIDEAYGVSIENATSCWLLTTPIASAEESNEEATAPVVSDLRITKTNENTVILSCKAEADAPPTVYFSIWKIGDNDSGKWLLANKLNTYYYLEISEEEFLSGDYQCAVFACDNSGNYCATPMSTLPDLLPEEESNPVSAVNNEDDLFQTTSETSALTNPIDE